MQGKLAVYPPLEDSLHDLIRLEHPFEALSDVVV